jgi:hypothetical protein
MDTTVLPQASCAIKVMRVDFDVPVPAVSKMPRPVADVTLRAAARTGWKSTEPDGNTDRIIDEKTRATTREAVGMRYSIGIMSTSTVMKEMRKIKRVSKKCKSSSITTVVRVPVKAKITLEIRLSASRK